MNDQVNFSNSVFWFDLSFPDRRRSRRSLKWVGLAYQSVLLELGGTGASLLESVFERVLALVGWSETQDQISPSSSERKLFFFFEMSFRIEDEVDDLSKWNFTRGKPSFASGSTKSKSSYSRGWILPNRVCPFLKPFQWVRWRRDLV